ncbi:arginine-tRNA ligase, partial [Colletotrichum asianum]
YLNDLDRWSILALVKTCPRTQARPLGDFFQKHLCGRSFIGVSFASNGPPMFTLEFHLPFKAWRKSKRLIVDERIRSSDRTPLRTSKDMSYMMLPGGQVSSGRQTVHGLYSGHIAYMITGFDQNRWTAHFAVDTWFEESDDGQDRVMRYEDDLEYGIEFDPLSCGRNDARKPIWHPRAYFLEVIQNRLEHVKDEWELILQNIEVGVSNLANLQNQLAEQYRDRRSSSDPLANGMPHVFDASDKIEMFAGNLKETLQDVLQILNHTRKTGDSFLATDVNFFLSYDGHHGDASECYPFLAEIRRKLQEIGQMSILFESLEARCDFIMSRHFTASPKVANPNVAYITSSIYEQICQDLNFTEHTL